MSSKNIEIIKYNKRYFKKFSLLLSDCFEMENDALNKIQWKFFSKYKNSDILLAVSQDKVV
jgi:hypothetical protein